MSTRGTQDRLERRLRELSLHGDENAIAPRDLSARVMARLPQGTPTLYRDVAALVLEAWTDEALRGQLRSAPAETMAERGLLLPQQLQVVVVPPSQAVLPTADRLVLPIADPDPMSSTTRPTADEVRALLLRTEWRWLLQDPVSWTEVPATAPRTSPHAADSEPQERAFAWRKWLSRRSTAAPAWALIGAAAVVLLLVWSGAGDGLGLISDPGGASGTAATTPPWSLLAAAVIAITALYWWNGRRGG